MLDCDLFDLLAQLVECRILYRKIAVSNLTRGLEQDTSSSLLSTGSTQENVAT